MSSSEAVRSGFAAVSGGRLYYEMAGTGHPLVLSHEGIADSRMYDDQFAVFAERYQTIRYDLRGFGQSSQPTGPFSYAEDLAELLRAPREAPSAARDAATFTYAELRAAPGTPTTARLCQVGGEGE